MNAFHSHRLQQRATIARGLVAAAFAVLVVAFFRAQIVHHERFQLRAEANRLRLVYLPPPRGLIYDRRGEVIAENVPGYAVKLLAPSEDSLRAVLSRVALVVPLDASQRAEVIRRYQTAPHEAALIFNDGSFEVVSRLEEHRALLPGLVIQAEPKRVYPNGPAVAHLVGYVGEVTGRDLDERRFEGARMGTIVGRSGLELAYDATLRGRTGVQYIEVNAFGRLVRDEGVAPTLAPTAGQPIRTTIDLGLQRYVDSLWRADGRGFRGALVAMTPQGEILALYSWPAFDPNQFIGGISRDDWRQLNTDPANPLFNRAIQARYPPASPFKLATAAMDMRRGLVRIESRMPEPCRGGLQMGNRYFRCWKKEGHGSLDLEGAIAKSCDVYFYQLGLRLGLDAILSDGVLLGFRDRTGVDLENEAAPIYPSTTAYFDRVYGPSGWNKWGATLNFSIGQGENTQTLINMMRFYQALAADGQAVAPYLVAPKTRQVRTLGLDAQQLADLRRALVMVVERGTAAASRRADLSTAGKTGTAQNSHGKDHGWYIGFAPADDPEIVVGAILEFAEHGSAVAPLVVKVMHRYIRGAGPTEPITVVAPEDSAPRAVRFGPDAFLPLAVPPESTQVRLPRP